MCDRGCFKINTKGDTDGGIVLVMNLVFVLWLVVIQQKDIELSFYVIIYIIYNISLCLIMPFANVEHARCMRTFINNSI